MAYYTIIPPFPICSIITRVNNLQKRNTFRCLAPGANNNRCRFSTGSIWILARLGQTSAVNGRSFPVSEPGFVILKTQLPACLGQTKREFLGTFRKLIPPSPAWGKLSLYVQRFVSVSYHLHPPGVNVAFATLFLLAFLTTLARLGQTRRIYETDYIIAASLHPPGVNEGS